MEDSVKQKKQEKIGGKDREKWKQLQSKRTASKAAESITDWKQVFTMPNSISSVHYDDDQTEIIYSPWLTQKYLHSLYTRQFSFFLAAQEISFKGKNE